jgi:Xaa-Pro aminopeptidase
VGPGEVTPGISAAEFHSRRRALVELMPPGAVAVVASAQQAYITGMIPYPYRQEADFLYLTGVCQPGVALISPSCYTLFVPNPDPQVGTEQVPSCSSVTYLGFSMF